MSKIEALVSTPSPSADERSNKGLQIGLIIASVVFIVAGFAPIVFYRHKHIAQAQQQYNKSNEISDYDKERDPESGQEQTPRDNENEGKDFRFEGRFEIRKSWQFSSSEPVFVPALFDSLEE